MVKSKKLTEQQKRARGDRTLSAIVLQAAALYFAIQPINDPENTASPLVVLLIKLVPLLITTVWMLYNWRYEEDLDQRQQNTKIELVYLVVQFGAALIGYLTNQPYYAGITIISLSILYILVINPNFMNRKLATKGKNDKKI